MKTNQDLLEPMPGYSRELAFYLSSMEKARRATRELLEDLTPEEMARRVLPALHSIGALALHLGECEYYWIQEVAGKRKLSGEEMKWAHMFDTMENDADRGFTAGYCIERIDAISEKTREMLKKYTDDDLEKVYLREYDDVRTEITLRSILHRLIDHEAHHRGQIAMIKRLLRGGETADK